LSAVSQTYSELEIIVVDDGSSDRTADLVRAINDPRIRYLYQANAGQGNARNNAIARSRGSYITFLDADDFYSPHKVEHQVEFLEAHRRYRLVYCNALHVYGERPTVSYKKKANYRSGQILPELLLSSYINPNTVMAAREVFERCGGFVETRYYPEEWDLWLRIALAGFEFGYLDEDLVTVEIREGSNTTMAIQPILKKNAIAMFEKLLPTPVLADGVRCNAASTVKRLRLKLALAYLANGRRREFAMEFAEGLGSGLLAQLAAYGLMITPRGVVRKLWQMNQLRNSTVASQS